MAFTPKEPLNIAAVGGDGKQTGFTKIKNEITWLYETILSGLFSPSTGHKHTGAVNDAPKIGTGGIADGAITTDLLSDDIVSPNSIAATFAKGVPIGFIGIWSGSVADIAIIDTRYGVWKLCDGTNGTKDLRNMFVVGAGSTYTVGATGGEATHVLMATEIPGHRHLNVVSSANNQAAATANNSIPRVNGYNGANEQAVMCGDSGEPDVSRTSSVGGGLAHNNLPPYYSLAYIQRTA